MSPVPRRSRAPRLVELLAVFMALGIAPIAAAVEGPESPGEIHLPAAASLRLADGGRRAALETAPEWIAFRARHGDWRALWNDATGTPHRSLGPSITLAGFADDSASVDQAVRRFVAENPGVFGAPSAIEPRSVRRHGALWYASYRQQIDGQEVLFADWEFRVGVNGRLVLFGADAIPTSGRSSFRASIAPAAARAAATSGLDFVPGRDVAESGPAAVLPLASGSGIDLRIVIPVTIRTARPPSNWLVLVDAASGAVLMRVDRARTIGGHVTSLVHPVLPTDPLTQQPVAHQYVFAGGDSTVSDASGAWSLPTTGTVTVSAELRGPFADVTRTDLFPVGSNDAHFSTTAGSGAVVDIAWGNDGISHDAERDAFRNGNIAHDFVKTLDPGFLGLDVELPLYVNYPYGHCNAVWVGTGIYLFSAGDGCVNTATAPDVLYHEYGHAVNDRLYERDGFPNGMMNSSLQEGTADLNAAFIEDDPVVGNGFAGPGSYVRRIDEPHRWPDDVIPDPHANGQVVSGSLWDLRNAIGLPLAERLCHQAKHGHPDDAHDIVAFLEMFLEVLAADDDDGNLANGTPHAAAIAHAFGAHGIGPNAWIAFDHTPGPDPPTGGLIPITATIRYTGPVLTSLDVNSPTLHYALNTGGFTSVTMTPTGVADQFGASIPAPVGSVFAYYITARDGFGDEAVFPPGAPAQRVVRMLAGPATPRLTWDMSTNPGWTVGAPGDNATSGVWVRANPMGTSNSDTANFVPIQPADDHTPGDTLCWVTGNADTLFVPGYNDVDDGHTTLTTARFDALMPNYDHPVVEYWRWYTNNTGNNIGGDAFHADISNDDGVTWVPIENLPNTVNSWERVLARVEDYVAPTHLMRMRFVANDDLPTSIVEAAIDDFRLLAFASGIVATETPRPPGTLELLAPRPNPSFGSATFRFRLPAPVHVRLGIYDVFGRRVRSLIDGALGAGEHEMAWDGRDEARRGVPGGLYFARLEAGGELRVQRIARVN